jgi:hypothetical protein
MNAYEDDLEQLYSALSNHPAILTGEKEKAALDALYARLRTGVSSPESLIDAATEMTVFFGDGHTNIELPYTPRDRCVNLKCRWNEADCRELLLAEGCEGISEGARVLRVEGMDVRGLIRALAGRIPHENIYLVKSRMIHYPYQNYHMFSEMNLKRLFGEKEAYRVDFAANGEELTGLIPLAPYAGVSDFVPDEAFLSYEVSGDTAILHLHVCIFNEAYEKNLRELARLCGARGIRALVLDLSRNMGGDSSVIEPFIAYTRAACYRLYEMTDYSSGKGVVVTSRTDTVENRRQDVLFPENIYCRVSHDTFSSARTFAVTLKDNGIARIVGPPTGGKPNSYGMPRKMLLPHSGIRFRVSRARFMRPDAAKDNEISLTGEPGDREP